MNLEADIDVMLTDFGEDATHNGNTAKVLVDLVDKRLLEAQGITAVLGEIRTITYRTGAFPGLEVGQSITIGGTTYEVVDRQREADGRLSHAMLGAT